MSNPESARSDILDLALLYIKRGWPVFPVHSIDSQGICTCHNIKCEHPGKHPRTKNGVKDASTDENQIREWFARNPDSNIGIAMGERSGVFVVDIDGEEGEESLRSYEEQNGRFPETLQVLTGRGRHYYLKQPPIPIKNRVCVLPKIDVKTTGGYVIAPPSKHANGKNYVFEVSTIDLEPAEVPPHFLKLLTQSDVPEKKDATLNQTIIKGTRNETLASIAGSLRSRGADFETIKAALEAINQRQCDPPLPATDIEAIAKSISGYSSKEDTSHHFIASQLARAKEWPKGLSEKAFYGLTGEIVRAIEPHSEADPAALLGQFLVCVGNVVGRFAHFRAEGTQHFPNEFLVLVGQTSKGRKGSAFAQIKRFFHGVDDKWLMSCHQSGMSSGEGVVFAVRDPVEKSEPIRDKSTGDVIDYRVVVIDPGIEDKRLVACAPEFASTLRSIDRQGNILSSVLREAWDAGNLRTLTKNSPVKATSCHVSLIAHITAEELRRELSRTEIANGFGNRFLFFLVRRSKCLPDGGQIESVDLGPLIMRLSKAIEFGTRLYEMHRDAEAAELWRSVYPKLSEGQPGLYGALLGRAEAHVMRLAVIYALLDQSADIRLPHLEAALAVWDYCQASVIYIFGDTIGNPIADAILSELKNRRSMTLTEVSDLLGRHAKSEQIASALAVLRSMDLIEIEHTKTSGRPAVKIILKGESHEQKT